MEVKGRKVLVTGGSAGIGREIALQLAQKGATVLIVGRDLQRLEEAVAKFPQAINALPADLSMATEVDRLAATIAREHPDLALLVNNAALQSSLDLTAGGSSLPAIRAEIGVNFEAVVALAVALLPVLADNKPAAIVNLTSALAVAPKAAAPVYCATKAAVRNFSRGLRYQCEDAALGVSVIEVVMALVDTGMILGRGKGKISPETAARHVIDAIEHGLDEVWVGATKMIRALHRISPRLAERVLR